MSWASMRPLLHLSTRLAGQRYWFAAGLASATIEWISRRWIGHTIGLLHMTAAVLSFPTVAVCSFILVAVVVLHTWVRSNPYIFGPSVERSLWYANRFLDYYAIGGLVSISSTSLGIAAAALITLNVPTAAQLVGLSLWFACIGEVIAGYVDVGIGMERSRLFAFAAAYPAAFSILKVVSP